uniref:Uncharacterized protein n=1 Tax=Brassica oleracea TaxID=3712 RepID=A0A3P6ET56_BRAOL|nr:unnamed protein product [Brassica oleracea]
MLLSRVGECFLPVLLSLLHLRNLLPFSGLSPSRMLLPTASFKVS